MATRESPKLRSSTSSSRRGYKNTEAGLSKKQIDAILKWEKANMGAELENEAVIDKNGVVNPLGDPVVERLKADVRVNAALIPPDAIVTHTHPRPEGRGMGAEIGTSLSGADIVNAIALNNREKRAVTENYIYSIKRPANGWGMLYNPQESLQSNVDRLGRTIGKEWDSIYNAFIDKYNYERDVLQGKITFEEYEVRFARREATASHYATRAIAKKYGFIYARRRS